MLSGKVPRQPSSAAARRAKLVEVVRRTPRTNRTTMTMTRMTMMMTTRADDRRRRLTRPASTMARWPSTISSPRKSLRMKAVRLTAADAASASIGLANMARRAGAARYRQGLRSQPARATPASSDVLAVARGGGGGGNGRRRRRSAVQVAKRPRASVGEGSIFGAARRRRPRGVATARTPPAASPSPSVMLPLAAAGALVAAPVRTPPPPQPLGDSRPLPRRPVATPSAAAAARSRRHRAPPPPPWRRRRAVCSDQTLTGDRCKAAAVRVGRGGRVGRRD